jgi:uncharacterized protein (TIGR02147 family)
LNEKKPLSMSKVVEFSELLKMDEKKKELFIAAANAERSLVGAQTIGGALRLKRKKMVPSVYFEVEADRYKLLQEWYHVPLLDLTATRDFKNDPRWIAKRLGISTDQARSGLDRLIRLGLLEATNGSLKKTHANIWITTKKSKRLTRTYHQHMLQRAIDHLEVASGDTVDQREVSSVTIPIDPAKLPEAKRRIDKFRRSLWRFLTDGENLELYQFNLQLFPLTVTVKNSKGQILKRANKRSKL